MLTGDGTRTGEGGGDDAFLIYKCGRPKRMAQSLPGAGECGDHLERCHYTVRTIERPAADDGIEMAARGEWGQPGNAPG